MTPIVLHEIDYTDPDNEWGPEPYAPTPLLLAGPFIVEVFSEDKPADHVQVVVTIAGVARRFAVVETLDEIANLVDARRLG